MTLTEGADVPRRRRDLLRCVEHVSTLRRAGGGLLLFTGPAGIGKSTMARMVQAATEQSAPLIVSATHPSLEPTLGLWNRLAVLAGAAHERLDQPGVDRFAATLTMLRELGRQSSSVVVLDDLHAADPDSLTLLAHIAPVLASTDVTIIATSRGVDAVTDELGQAAHVAVESQAIPFALGPLDADDVRERLAMVPHVSNPPPNALVEAFLTESGGNPLILEWLITDCLSDRTTVPPPAEVAEMSSGSTVVDRWKRTLDRVDPSDRTVLGVIIGLADLARTETVRAVTGDAGTRRSIDRLIASGLVVHHRRPGPVALSHPAIAEALTLLDGRLSPDRHVRIVQVLIELGADARSVLWHMVQAGERVSVTERRAMAVQVARTCTERGDPRAAAEAWDIAIGCGETAPADLVAAARARRAAGDRLRSRELARSAMRAADVDTVTMADAALVAADGAEFHSDAPAAVSGLRHALDLLPVAGDESLLRRRVAVLGALAHLEMTLPVGGPELPIEPDPIQREVLDQVRWHWVTRPEVAQPLADEAELVAEQIGDPVTLAQAGLAWRLTHQSPDHARARRTRSERARVMLTGSRERADALHAVVLDALESGDVAESRVALGELGTLASDTGDPSVRWRHSHTVAMFDHLEGRPADAEMMSDIAGKYGALAGEPTAVIVRLEQRTVFGLDRLVGMDTIWSLAGQLDSVSHPPVLAGVLHLMGELERCGHARPGVDRDVLSQVAGHLRTHAAHEQNWGLTAAFVASAAATTGDVGFAHRVLEVIADRTDLVARESSGIVSLGHLGALIGRLRVLVGDGEAGRAMIERAIERDRAAGFERAVLAGRIALLDASRHQFTARELRRAAMEIGTEAAQREIHLLAGIARRLGSGSRTVALSDRQRAILAGLAAGLRYEGIADHIGYSHGTVRSEVSRIYRALGVDGRDAAVAEAEWLGLVAPTTAGT